MKTYRTNDGEVIRADNARDLVIKLRALSHDQDGDEQEFMDAAAGRVFQQNGTLVSTTNHEDFVAGLVLSGLLKED